MIGHVLPGVPARSFLSLLASIRHWRAAVMPPGTDSFLACAPLCSIGPWKNKRVSHPFLEFTRRKEKKNVLVIGTNWLFHWNVAFRRMRNILRGWYHSLGKNNLFSRTYDCKMHSRYDFSSLPGLYNIIAKEV